MSNDLVRFLIGFFLILSINLFSEDNPTEGIDIQLRKEYQIPDSREVLLDITVIVPKGNHIFIDQKDKDSSSILSEFIIPDGSGVELIETIKPIGEVFEKDIVIRGSRMFQLKLKNIKERSNNEKARVPFEFRVQMCNDTSGICYMPYTFKMELKVVFLKKPKTKRTAASKDGINWVYKHSVGLEEAARLNKNLFVLITAPDWCGPCTEFAPVFKSVAEKLPEGLFIKVDVDTSPVLCNDFNVEWIPYVVALYNGEVIEEAPWDEDSVIKWAQALIKNH